MDGRIDMGKKKKNITSRWSYEREGEGMEWNREEWEKEVIERERNKMRRKEEERIKNARYNPKYREIKVAEGYPSYLKEGNLEEIDKGEKVRALIKLRCDNLENANKY